MEPVQSHGNVSNLGTHPFVLLIVYDVLLFLLSGGFKGHHFEGAPILLFIAT